MTHSDVQLRAAVTPTRNHTAAVQAATGGLERTGQRRPVEVEREAVRPLDEVCSHALPIGEHEFHARHLFRQQPVRELSLKPGLEAPAPGR
jgi:hypothetical protein